LPAPTSPYLQHFNLDDESIFDAQKSASPVAPPGGPFKLAQKHRQMFKIRVVRPMETDIQ
jgi:hypothetical protein